MGLGTVPSILVQREKLSSLSFGTAETLRHCFLRFRFGKQPFCLIPPVTARPDSGKVFIIMEAKFPSGGR